MIELYLGLPLAASLTANLVFAYLVFFQKKKKPEPDLNAQQVLAELLAGPAVFRIEAVDRGSLIQWKGYGK